MPQSARRGESRCTDGGVAHCGPRRGWFTRALLREWERFVDFARTYRADGGTPLDDPINRQLLADLRVKLGMFRAICWKGAWDSRQGEDVSRIASISRVLSGELVQELWRGFTRIIGDAAQVMPHGAAGRP